jgi:acyl-CoA synthetase (AMP-forming)/AMP-acid ligase II/pyruvate/2-oxoacid:ferredoxin oxidoreductase alpha subunit
MNYPQKTLPQLLESRAGQHGPRTFLLFQEERLSYAGLAEEAGRVARVLEGMGVSRQEKVALLLDNCPLWVSVFFGIVCRGAVLVPINPRYSAEEMARVLRHSDSSGLIFADKYRPVVQAARASCPQLGRLLAVGELRDLLARTPAGPLPSAVSPEDLAAIIYTSGTTGSPKGVMLTHYNYVTNAFQAARCKKMSPEDRFLTALPLCHVAPQVGAVLAHLVAGGSVALLDGFSPESFLASVPKYQATAFGGVPTVYAIFLALPNRERYDFSCLRYCNTSAAPMPLELRERVRQAFKTDPLESYGLTEATCGSACNPIEGVRKAGSVGLPLEDQEVRVVDDCGRVLPAGQVGELEIRGPTVMKGYYKDPELTAKVIRDGWLATGDLARLDEDGYIFLAGRKKEIIIRGGEKIYPGEVEAVIYRHPKVLEAVVVGLPDPFWGERVHACLIPQKGQSVPAEEILALCRSALADYEVPVSVSFHEEFPRTSTNKVKRSLLSADLEKKFPPPPPPKRRAERAERIVMKGCEAVAEAAIRAGCHAYFGYPITPSSEFVEHMARRLPPLGRVFIQPPSEVTAVYMMFGAAAAGFRTMTSSSGPGISLMQEGISYLCAAELPAVIANFCRNGPGLSGISGSQVDYFQAVKGGGHGGYRQIVLAPRDAQEAVGLTYEAFDLADRYRNPVMIFCDGFLAQMIESVSFPPYQGSPPAKPWAVSGRGSGPRRLLPAVTPSREVPPVLMAKYRRIEKAERRSQRSGCGKDVLLVAFGTAARICESVIEPAAARGLDVGLFRPVTLWPFPAPELQAAAEGTRRLLVVEFNYGQMVEDVRLAIEGLRPVSFLGKAAGVIPRIGEILAKIEELTQ